MSMKADKGGVKGIPEKNGREGKKKKSMLLEREVCA